MAPLDHPDSFGALYFSGDVLPGVPALLQRCGFQVLSSTEAVGTLAEVYARLTADEDVLRKGAYQAGRWTVLLDPDLELYTEEHHLAAFCAEYDCRVLAALWEREQKTVVLSEFNAAGLRRQTMWEAGRPDPDGQRDPRPEVAADPSYRGLMAALIAAGAPAEDATQIQAVVWRLDE